MPKEIIDERYFTRPTFPAKLTVGDFYIELHTDGSCEGNGTPKDFEAALKSLKGNMGGVEVYLWLLLRELYKGNK